MKESCGNCAKVHGRFICYRAPNAVAVKPDGWCSDWEPKLATSSGFFYICPECSKYVKCASSLVVGPKSTKLKGVACILFEPKKEADKCCAGCTKRSQWPSCFNKAGCIDYEPIKRRCSNCEEATNCETRKSNLVSDSLLSCTDWTPKKVNDCDSCGLIGHGCKYRDRTRLAYIQAMWPGCEHWEPKKKPGQIETMASTLKYNKTIREQFQTIKEQEAKIAELKRKNLGQSKTIISHEEKIKELNDHNHFLADHITESEHLPPGKYSWPPIEFQGKYLVYSGSHIYEIRYVRNGKEGKGNKFVIRQIELQNA